MLSVGCFVVMLVARVPFLGHAVLVYLYNLA
jgi:hypothetical protein